MVSSLKDFVLPDGKFFEKVSKFSDIVLFSNEDIFIFQQYDILIKDSEELKKEFSEKIWNIVKNKIVVGIHSTESFTMKGLPRKVWTHPNFHYVTGGNKDTKLAAVLNVKAHMDPIIEDFKDEVYKEDTLDKKYILSYLSRRGSDKRFNFFKLCYEHKDDFLINCANFHYMWQHILFSHHVHNNETIGKKKQFEEVLYFKTYKDVTFPYITEPEEFGCNVHHEKKWNSGWLLKTINLIKKSKFNLVLGPDEWKQYIDEKSILPFVSKSIPIFTQSFEHRNALTKIGFYTFDELYEDIDEKLSYKGRSTDGMNILTCDEDYKVNEKFYLQYKKLLDKINSKWGHKFYKENQDKIEHNFQLCKSITNNTYVEDLMELVV